MTFAEFFATVDTLGSIEAAIRTGVRASSSLQGNAHELSDAQWEFVNAYEAAAEAYDEYAGALAQAQDKAAAL